MANLLFKNTLALTDSNKNTFANCLEITVETPLTTSSKTMNSILSSSQLLSKNYPTFTDKEEILFYGLKYHHPLPFEFLKVESSFISKHSKALLILLSIFSLLIFLFVMPHYEFDTNKPLNYLLTLLTKLIFIFCFFCYFKIKDKPNFKVVPVRQLLKVNFFNPETNSYSSEFRTIKQEDYQNILLHQ